MSVWGGFSQGFRAPVLNELYRQFRVGQELNLPNAELGPERLTAVEGGLTVMPARQLLIRAAFYDNHIKDPVSRVVVSQSGAAITYRRANLGKTRVTGAQFDVEYRLNGELDCEGRIPLQQREGRGDH